MPHVTIIRPCSGIEPYLYECLTSTFCQQYPAEKLTVYFCVSTQSDPAYPVIQQALKDFPSHDARVFLEEEDSLLGHDGKSTRRIGPNPKIRNISRAYREAKGDILWILDCNVWVGKGACGRMVDKLCGFNDGKVHKFVHHVPVCIDVTGDSKAFTTNTLDQPHQNGDVSPVPKNPVIPRSQHRWGGRLEEMFLSSSHIKFYVAINTVALAPCVNGKSNMFRRSHLDYLTSSPSLPRRAKGSILSRSDVMDESPSTAVIGIDAFSHYICEDHLIGELLWGYKIAGAPRKMSNHGLVMGDLVIQPIANMSMAAYIARRVRWQRVRKFTVTLATLIEPATECFLCSVYGAFGVATLLTDAKEVKPIWCQESGSWWTTFLITWMTSVVVWASTDWFLYRLLHSGSTIEAENSAEGEKVGRVPDFVQTPNKNSSKRSFLEWLIAWMGREALALPIWTWAFWGGTTVVWRNRRFKVGMDMRVREIQPNRDAKI